MKVNIIAQYDITTHNTPKTKMFLILPKKNFYTPIPAELYLNPGIYKVFVTCPGYHSTTKEIIIQKNKLHYTVKLQLFVVKRKIAFCFTRKTITPIKIKSIYINSKQISEKSRFPVGKPLTVEIILKNGDTIKRNIIMSNGEGHYILKIQ